MSVKQEHFSKPLLKIFDYSVQFITKWKADFDNLQLHNLVAHDRQLVAFHTRQIFNHIMVSYEMVVI